MLAVNLGQGNDINIFNHFCQLVVRHGLGDQLELSLACFGSITASSLISMAVISIRLLLMPCPN